MSDSQATVTYSEQLGALGTAIEAARETFTAGGVLERIWRHDHAVWKDDPREIGNRLGWLRTPVDMVTAVPEIESLVNDVRKEGFTHALLLGMGGSSLAPEVYRLVFGVAPGFLDLAVLDSTDPGAVHAAAQRLDLDRTLFIVSTKSGGTVETLSFFQFFHQRVAESKGADAAGRQFVAITDPESGLADLARRAGFRKTFLNDPEIGGRYSALSFFGLVPAALIGVDIRSLLKRASAMAKMCHDDDGTGPATKLGTALGQLAELGRDKLTLVPSDSLAPFGAWIEQLVAESTGKEGKGILPVDGEPIGPSASYGDDRVFVSLGSHDEPNAEGLRELSRAGHPTIHLGLGDRYDLGGQFFLWEMATAIAGWKLGINPFDQPNVEAAKILARKMVESYQTDGSLPTDEPSLRENGLAVFADRAVSSVHEVLAAFFDRATPGAYVAIQAYVQPTEETTAALQLLRTKIRDRLHVATTVGYGPRFLHSTGQLHKGDGGSGLFLQLTDDRGPELPIPSDDGNAPPLTFGVLKLAQALGDRSALLEAGRAVLRFHADGSVVDVVQRLTTEIP